MEQLRYCLIPLLCVLASLAISGCSSNESSNGWPKVLRYAYSPATEQLEGGTLRTELMVKYLEQQLHMPVQIVSVDHYSATIEAMRADKIDMANFGALAYIIASQKADAQAIVTRGFPDGKMGGYRSVVAVPKDSPIHSMQDLKTDAKNIVFAFADPASTSGDLYPRVGLQSAGIDPDKDFRKVVYAGGHLPTVMSLAAGKIDAAGFMESMLTHQIAAHKLAPDAIRVIWTSDLIPNECYAVRKGMPDKLKKQIQAALIAIPTKDPALWDAVNKLFHTSTRGTQYIRVDDASYNGLRNYAAQVKDFSFVGK